METDSTDDYCENAKLPHNFNVDRLKRQIHQLLDLQEIKKSYPKTTADVLELLMSLDPVTQLLFSEVIKLITLIQCQPISAASSERSFSCLRRLKTWLRTNMTQKRLTHLCLLTVHRDRVAQLDMQQLMKYFCSKTPERSSVLGCF